jgi:hypothetical protein
VCNETDVCLKEVAMIDMILEYWNKFFEDCAEMVSLRAEVSKKERELEKERLKKRSECLDHEIEEMKYKPIGKCKVEFGFH